MKKLMVLALFVVVGAFVACGDSTPAANNPPPASSGSAAAPADSTPAATPAK